MRWAIGILLLFAAAFAGDEKKFKHPYLDDLGTLRWYKTLDEAKAAAKKEEKLILVAYGHEG